jgi:hypothetical protein
MISSYLVKRRLNPRYPMRSGEDAPCAEMEHEVGGEDRSEMIHVVGDRAFEELAHQVGTVAQSQSSDTSK